ncbi:hypothetical protein ILUMI_22482 [Ignelater luminosus]|uniref:THAP-type domain-containing protein n=1 Tax=Ignelater luminosus TaxID=2038154 RepID=A0A8K0CCQ8_IGNLU|nr:hypothetical protein ILUMI_22482 [Ignelater luminosus]
MPQVCFAVKCSHTTVNCKLKPFLADPERKKRWTVNIRRDNWEATPSDQIDNDDNSTNKNEIAAQVTPPCNLSEDTKIARQDAETRDTERQDTERQDTERTQQTPNTTRTRKRKALPQITSSSQPTTTGKILSYPEKRSTVGEHDEIDKPFLGYAATVRRLSARRQTLLKFSIAKLLMQHELE